MKEIQPKDDLSRKCWALTCNEVSGGAQNFTLSLSPSTLQSLPFLFRSSISYSPSLPAFQPRLSGCMSVCVCVSVRACLSCHETLLSCIHETFTTKILTGSVQEQTVPLSLSLSLSLAFSSSFVIWCTSESLSFCVSLSNALTHTSTLPASLNVSPLFFLSFFLSLSLSFPLSLFTTISCASVWQIVSPSK